MQIIGGGGARPPVPPYSYGPETVVRKLAVRHTSIICLTASFLAACGFVKLFHKIPRFSHDFFFQIP